MHKLPILWMIMLLCQFQVSAGNGDYAVKKIPAKLLENANVVVRVDEQVLDMQSLDKLLSRHHYVITVLNEEGDVFADMVESYDRFHEIRSIDGILYDAEGNKIKTLKNKDIQDLSGSSGMSLADDIRLKVHNFYYKVYPYTIEYTIEEVRRESMFFPSWTPVPDQHVSVEKSSFSIRLPKEYLLRYRLLNSQEPLIREEAGKKIYNWQLSDYGAVKKEFASPSWYTITPSVWLAPSEFVIEDYHGNMTDWNELGKFQNALNRGLDVLPDAIKKKVADLTRNITTQEEKVNVLYQFLQSTTRYISIQLGIGGWRPFNASYVASNSYGDCKALSNYMHALLKEAGIQSYYTLIKAGDNEDDIITDFPSRQFNHAIVCVPNGKDTIWLECTSQTQSAGYMGSFTGNRHALLITEEGGKLVSTPFYTSKENLQIRKLKAVLREDATLLINANSVYKGVQQDNLQMMINALSKDKVKERLHSQLDFGTYEISSFNYKEQKDKIPYIEETLEINVSNYATLTGKRLFIIPNIMTRSYQKLSLDTARKYDVVLKAEYKNLDTVEIELPKGYEAESIPKDVSIKTQFGQYNSSVKLSGNKLVYYRSMERFSGLFPARDYADLAKFYETIYKADRNRVVLVKNETLKAF